MTLFVHRVDQFKIGVLVVDRSAEKPPEGSPRSVQGATRRSILNSIIVLQSVKED